MNGFHQLALFIVLFGGFLAWGAWESLKISRLQRFNADWDEALEWNKGTWIPLKTLKIMVDELLNQNFFVTDNFTLDMNDQTKYIRPQIVGYVMENSKPITGTSFIKWK